MYLRSTVADIPQSERSKKEREGSHHACCDLASEVTPSIPRVRRSTLPRVGEGLTGA